jgi:FAD/FMN-containing dehydrogenase
VQFAGKYELLLAVRGGGHNVAGFATCDGGLVIDLSLMRGIRVDAQKHTARVEAGATWGDLDRETQAFGLAAPGGIVSTTGVAGLTLGGGQGWLRRTYGMTCDSVISADVVTADGEFLTASERDHPDLFWALRGGGGNFGVVTEFEYRLHPVGPIVAFAAPMYSMETAPRILSGFRAFAEAAADEVNVSATFWTIPPVPGFPSHLHGRDVLIVSGIYVGEPERGERVLEPLRVIDEPIFDMSTRLPYTALQQLFDPFFPKGELLYYWKAIYLDSLNDEVVAEIAAASSRRPSSMSMIAVWALGGAMRRMGVEETAVGSRDAPFVVEILANWKDPDATEQNIAWARHLFEAMRRFSSGKPNLNFPGLAEDTKQFVIAAFGPHYERLASVKRKFDPKNLFRLNQNIT